MEKLPSEWEEKLLKGEASMVLISELPEEERALLKTHGAKAALAVPITIENRFQGLLLLLNCREERLWEPAEIDFIRAAASNLAGALMQQRARKALRRSKAKMKSYAESLEREVEQRAMKIQEMEKLAAAGRLAAGIAHEINNPLAGIKNSFMLVKDCIPPDHKYFEYAGLIDKEIDRISSIIVQMSQLYRPENQGITSFDLSRTLNEVAMMVEEEIRQEGLTLIKSIPKDLPEVRMPEGGLRQILYNLLLNAIHASSPGKEILLSAGREDHEIAIRVKDHGVGIREEDLPRIFEPFFSTKKGQRCGGIGLGLAVCHSLSEAMGGRISVSTELQQGSIFTLHLPLS
jgi:signal transduction histidine kinase